MAVRIDHKQAQPIDWPYNSEAATRLLNTELIQKQGEFFLKRALNIRRLVAFVGSGASMAYGRVSWSELGQAQVTGIAAAEKRANAARADADPVKRLLKQLKSLEHSVKKEDPSSITLAMQLAEQFWVLSDKDLLVELARAFNLGNRIKGKQLQEFSPEEKRALFRASIKADTYDERHHAKRIFSNPFGGHDKVQAVSQKLVHRELNRFPSVPWPSIGLLFSQSVIEKTRHEIEKLSRSPKASVGVPATLLSFSGKITAALAIARTDAGTLNPFNYHALGLAIDLIRASSLWGGKRNNLSGLGQELQAALRKCTAKRPRARIIDRDKDPLWLLATDLEVRRYVTTNYDLEIERLIDDMNFEKKQYESQQHLDENEVERIRPMGGRARDIVLRDDNAVDLLDFAADNAQHSIQVAHLHGLATDADDVVVTDRDYQAKYVGDEPHQIIYREGMQVLFGGNPILFIGLGLSEGDVMRPLREFAGEHVRRNHSVIAVRHADKDEAEREAFIMEQYIRHGLYVVYYGFKPSPKGGGSRVCWFHKLAAYCKAMIEVLDCLSEDRPKSSAKTNDSIRDTQKRRSEFLDAFGLGSTSRPNEIRSTLSSFESDDAISNIALEFALLDAINEFLNDSAIRCYESATDKTARGILFDVVLRRAVKRIETAIQTVALTSYLRGLQKKWHTWQREWPKAPVSRLKNLRFATLEYLGPVRADVPHLSGLPKNLLPTRWFRHLIDESPSRQRTEPRINGLFRAWANAAVQSASSSRRIFLIAAPRGAGKGTLHGEFSTDADLVLNDNLAAVADLAAVRPTNRYAAQFSASFSFSSEIASVWDALIAFLLNPRTEVCATAADWHTDKVGRIGRLRRALEALVLSSKSEADAPPATTPAVPRPVRRYLVVLQAFDLLFEPDGYPKNAEIRAICDLLFAPDLNPPIDYVLVVRHTRIPLYFRGHTRKSARTDRERKCEGRVLHLLAERAEGYLADREWIAAAVKAANIRVDVSQSDAGADLKQALPVDFRGSSSSQDYIYFMPPLRVTEFRDLIDGLPDPPSDIPGFSALLASRFQLAIFMRVMTDAKEAGLDCIRLAPSLVGAGNSQGQIAADRFLERIFDYWAGRLYLDTNGRAYLSAILTSRGIATLSDRLLDAVQDSKLHELLVRHLAIIASPVEADVLRECPDIRSAVRKSLRGRSDVAHRDELRVIECALLLLADRGLAFTIHPRNRADGLTSRWARVSILRFQVHRSIQLHIYRRLGAQNVEPADAYFFSASLHASQTRELPILSAGAYAFLHELLNGLIGYPRNDATVPVRPGELHARCLRAGLGVARTLFSIGVVARFDDLGGIRVPLPPHPGYFEHHRLTLRWMLREATRLDGKLSPEEWNPYYPDEIVWLFNECGVFSLAQGQSSDAVLMLESALEAADLIEGTGNRPIRRRILLNLGACAINRGRPNEARRLLEEVSRESTEDETLILIAKGHLALLNHLGGAHDAAAAVYERVIKRLIALDRNRPASMFLRHRGELHRYKRDFKAATQDFSDAIDYARRGGSEDMAWFAMVAKARLDINFAGEFKHIAKVLDDAERYADAMELHMLKAEVCFVHGQILLRQGETALAAEKATQALRIASLNGLVLRAIAYRSLLADILHERGWLDESRRMKGQVLQAARGAGYRVLLQRHAAESGLDSENLGDAEYLRAKAILG